MLRPVLTITTDVSFDHTEILGDTLTEIAGEKGGIIKPGVRHVAGLLPGEAMTEIRRICRERKAPLVRLSPRDFRVCPDGLAMAFGVNGLQFDRVRPALHGRHQLRNCALVLRAVGELREAGYRIPKRAILDGLKEVKWPGRFQLEQASANGPTLVLDVCHNAAGAEAFADTFESVFPGEKATVILGLVKRKEHQKIVNSLSRIAKEFVLVPMKTKRTTDTRELAASLDWRGVALSRRGRLATAYGQVVKKAKADDIVAIIGSHYLVGEFLHTHGRL